MKAQPDYSIYLVTDESCLQGRALIDCVREALEGGVTLVQYRAKTASSAEMYAEALQLKALCDSFKVPLIINDRLDIAMAVGAAGVHLGQDDLPCAAARKLLGEDYIIGVSAHNPAEAKAALQSGADYLGCGAVFGTATKADVKKLGTEGLMAICREKGLPVVGIGGVTADNYREVRAAGADGAAIVSGILAQPDISATVEAIAKVSEEFAK
ncbi:thiamine-phosphate synthase [Phascolarctobacterium succinatutens CAG:287]|uniref:Thiamine-phosphate synthase n=1 Tax=Phascolarctobacterium succinatutens CAG:287 TaxID=1263101 RepID=R6Y129_9FIRM|nr:thiamine phosphate synthase [Phascolarctobacterium succinatutens]CDD12202.1 thiamine-phosphate synthase [Phascolarctobacterium succinatutens CAG:287]